MPRFENANNPEAQRLAVAQSISEIHAGPGAQVVAGIVHGNITFANADHQNGS